MTDPKEELVTVTHFVALLFVIMSFGAGGVVMAFFPRVQPRIINAWYAFLGMKSRVAEEDYLGLSVRLGGIFLIGMAIFIFVQQVLWR